MAISKNALCALRRAALQARPLSQSCSRLHNAAPILTHCHRLTASRPRSSFRDARRHLLSSTPSRFASSTSADNLMEDLNELYATARDEFEIAAEETQKKTVYAADDREAASEAFQALKEGFDKAVQQASPDVAKEIQGRVGQRIRELDNAITAMEEMAMED